MEKVSLEGMKDGYVAAIQELTDNDISRMINTTFNENKGQVSLEKLDQILSQRFNFSPLVGIKKQEIQLAEKELHANVYQVKEGIVYQNQISEGL